MTVAEVVLWGTTIGAVSLPAGEIYASFEYAPDFIRSGIELAPLMMPLSGQVFRFPALPREAFSGLPGMIADALPDTYGNTLIDAWLATEGRSPNNFDAVERLCYTGSRGMGALEFRPNSGPRAQTSESVEIDALVALASEVLRHREDLSVTFNGADKREALREIMRVGTSAGGARAKAIIAWNPDTNAVRSGQVLAPAGFQYWLIKFDGVAENRDRDLADPAGFGAVEFAYSQMAQEAGIQMSECRLFEEGGRRHFMTRRFDRTDDGDKLHMQSLAALAHFNYREPRSYSYEQAFLTMRELGLPQSQIVEQFRRMVFNIVARNQDDHVKNIAFLMDRQGVWRLSPAYDISWAYNPTGPWTSEHQMSVNLKRDGFTRDDLIAGGRAADITPRKVNEILDQILDVVRRWPDFASAVKVTDKLFEDVRSTLRLDFA